MKKYKVLFSERFLKELHKFDKSISKMLLSWIKKNLIDCENPRIKGKQLRGTLSNFWRYRIGDYRLLCEIKDDVLVIIVVAAGHRKDVYKV